MRLNRREVEDDTIERLKIKGEYKVYSDAEKAKNKRDNFYKLCLVFGISPLLYKLFLADGNNIYGTLMFILACYIGGHILAEMKFD